MVKRCVFCGKKLDESDRCQNHDCPDYIRTQIVEETEKLNAIKANGTSTTSN